MKICPRCEKTYPDSESFCETDGSALVSAGPAFADPGAGASSSGGKMECPVCGGQAEPGEVICNFCGTRLTPEEAVPQPPPEPRREAPRTRRVPTEIYRQSEGRASGPITGRQPRNRRLAVIGYLIAALLALVAGIYLALHLTPHEHEKLAAVPAASVVPTPAAAMAQPLVALANAIPLQAIPADGAPSSNLTTEVAKSRFDDNKSELLEAYKHVLSSNPGARDGMMVRLHVLPDGTVERAAVRASTSPNPELDARVAKSMMAWKFVATGGPEVDVDYPVIFTPSESELAKVESALQTKAASLTPSETPEYASSTTPPPAPAASPSPELAAVSAPALTPRAEARRAPRITRRHTRREELAAIPRPTPSLLERVQKTLRSNPKLRRVHAYTAEGTVTLYGKVFDSNDRLLAERVARGIPGVTGVVNTVTTDTAQWKAEEDKIKRHLANAGLSNVDVKVIGNDAYLSGTVKTNLERERAVTIAEGVAPVTVRSNIIRVEPGSIFGF